MSKYALAAFVSLYGLNTLIKTELPLWVLGVTALAAGVTLVAEAVKGKS